MDFHPLDSTLNSAVFEQKAAPSSGQKEDDLQDRVASFQTAIAEDAKLAAEELEERRSPRTALGVQLRLLLVVASRIPLDQRARKY